MSSNERSQQRRGSLGISPSRIVLGAYPTPVDRWDCSPPVHGLYLKRDDRVAPLYGGNKVRKLEYLLEDARRSGKRRLVTIGAAGSHQVVATALFGRQEGFETEAVLVAQPATAHAERNLRIALAHGLRPTVASSWLSAPALLLQRLGRDGYLLPLGGSNTLGSLGYVAAAHELAEQVAAGLLPEPDVVVVAMGSGGTAAGLAAGFEERGMRTRVVGVVISPPVAVSGAMARRLARKTAERLGLGRAAAARAAERIEPDAGWLGRGYGFGTKEGERATAVAAERGLVVEPTYTAKALACALARARDEKGPILYWHTLSSAELPDPGTAELAADVAALLRA